MTCYICGTKLVERKATHDQPYHYRASGLKNIFLTGITTKRCIKCASESPVIPRIEELHKLIAEDIADKNERLSGAEAKFLRKFAGLSAKRFAALLSIDPSHLSRFENGSTKHLSDQADKLARILAMSAIDQEYTRKILMQVADDRIESGKTEKRSKSNRPMFKLIKNHWEKAA